MKRNKIHHIDYLLDASGSMERHRHDLVRVLDAQIASLAEDSRNHPGEETRVSVFMFSSPHSNFECLMYDMDVLHVPSIAGLYRITGGTALCDAMVQVIEDISLIPEKYGEHFHLIYVLSDGEELHSSHAGRLALPDRVAALPGNVTLAGFTPSAIGKYYLTRYGLAPGNISVWDPAREGAVLEAGVAMAASTSGYLSGTRSGTMTSTRNLFQMNAPKAADLKKNLTPMTPGSYYFIPVEAQDLARVENGRIDQFMHLKTGEIYVPGRAYYQMTKRERIQHYKQVAVAILDKGSNTEGVYTGASARVMLGLPNDMGTEVRVSPGSFRDYAVFILSTSMNRKLVPGSRLLVMR